MGNPLCYEVGRGLAYERTEGFFGSYYDWEEGGVLPGSSPGFLIHNVSHLWVSGPMIHERGP